MFNCSICLNCFIFYTLCVVFIWIHCLYFHTFQLRIVCSSYFALYYAFQLLIFLDINFFLLTEGNFVLLPSSVQHQLQLDWDLPYSHLIHPPSHPPHQDSSLNSAKTADTASLTVDKWPSTIWPCNICPCNICPCNICPCNICPCNIFPFNICRGTKFGCLQLQPLLFGPNNQILN